MKNNLLGAAVAAGLLVFGGAVLHGQESVPNPPDVLPATEAPAPVSPPQEDGVLSADDATLTAELGEDGGRIVLEAKGVRPQVPLFFRADAEETIEVSPGEIAYRIAVRLRVVQGKARVLSLELGGQGDVQRVSGEGLKAWAVRRAEDRRFLDLEVASEDVKELSVMVEGVLEDFELPASPDLLHLRAGKAVGFTSSVNLHVPAAISARLVAAAGFLPLESDDEQWKRFEASLAERLSFAFTRSSAAGAPVELTEAWLEGAIDEQGGFATFQLRGTVVVRKEGAALDLLRGQAAASEVPAGSGYRLELVGGPSQAATYRLHFPTTGTFPVDIRIVARLSREVEWTNLSFEVPSGAIVPVILQGIPQDSEFRRDAAVLPTLDGEVWRGFLPLNGRCLLGWKPTRKTGEGKLFFTTTSRVNVGVGAGLLRQTSIIDYKILQGKLDTIAIALEGPGEVLEVDGENVLGWTVVEEDGVRRLEVRLSRPIEGESGLRVRSQLALGAFPVRAQALRLIPSGSIRHSGFIRIYNIGATRLEVAGIEGLTQLSPEQFPEQNLPGGDRQVFVYRFPAAAHAYEIAADRVQPEVTVSQILEYELSDSDRTVRADLELDIREAPLREWDLFVPADYSVVSVAGAEVADYVVGTQVQDNERTLKVLFAQEVMGRQLVKVHLEKNEPAEAGEWILPRLRNPSAKTVRGEIGVASVPGYRIVIVATDKLTEIPLSRFQKSRPDLQQTFRIRERDWSATLAVEILPQSVEADVFHLYSLKDQTAYASVVLNYFVTGAPVSVFRLVLPETAGNVTVECKAKAQERFEGDNQNELVVPLHQPVIGPFTMLVTYEESVSDQGNRIRPGQVVPQGVRGERGFIQVVSPVQVDAQVNAVSPALLSLDPLELPAEFRLLSAAPPLATYQYTGRPFEFEMSVDWFESGDTVPQVIDIMEAESRVTQDGQVLTEAVMIVKTRGRRVLRAELPKGTSLWEVTVDERPVSARQDGDFHLIPLPSGADANAPVRVKLQVGKPVSDHRLPVVTLPAFAAPIIKANWRIEGEKGRVLVPLNHQLPLDQHVLSETGLEWIAGRAVGWTALLFAFLVVGVLVRGGRGRHLWVGLGGMSCLLVALVMAVLLAKAADANQRGNLEALEFSLSVIAPGQQPSLVVGNYSEFGARMNWIGLVGILGGLGLMAWSCFTVDRRFAFRLAGGLLVAVGLLMQGGGASLFYLATALVILLLLIPWIVRWWGGLREHLADSREKALQALEEKEQENKEEKKKDKKEKEGESDGPLPGPSTACLLLAGMLAGLLGAGDIRAQEQQAQPVPVIPEGMHAADHLSQDWVLKDGRLAAEGTLRLTGKPGDSFLFLRAPAILTSFEGDRLRVGKREVAGAGPCYVVSILSSEVDAPAAPAAYTARFAYEMQVGEEVQRIPVPSGVASVQELGIQYDQGGWEFDSAAAMRVTTLAEVPEGHSGARLLLAPAAATEIILRPKARDVKKEATQFFAEVANLFLPSPGVIDGRHLVAVRPSQGEVSELSLTIPEGFTVSEVSSGPVGQWQFDAEARVLRIVVAPAQARPFTLLVETQSSLAPLPTDTTVAPVTVSGTSGEVGLVAVAFGAEAQPEKAEPINLSAVNLTDFDPALIPDRGGAKPVLHQVYRYGQGGGSLALRVAPVAPELRVASRQVLSIGDERLILAVNFVADITRAGLFQVSFPLPAGMEVESLSGAALSHWTELTEDDARVVILHLNGRTMGRHEFSLTLSGAAPDPTPDGGEGWLVPRFEIREAQRQIGDLVVKPTTGIRLEAAAPRNVSDVDPREVGGEGEGALGFKLLQADWELRLAIRKDTSWIKGEVLHEIVLREGQTRTSLVANLSVERASIRSLRVRLPGLSESEAKSLRASGSAVSDIVQVPDEADLWEIQFKRRMLGGVTMQIEWERTEGTGEGGGERKEWSETLRMAEFPDLRQTSYYFAVRASARLELAPESLPKGWQRVDWGAVPQPLRESGDRSIPALAMRGVPAEDTLVLNVRRHSVARALNLMVERGEFVTVISPVGELLTSVRLDFQVVQRSTLEVSLPGTGKLYNVFVNGESVSVVVEGDAYQFYVLPGGDGRTASVDFVYSSPGQDLSRLQLMTPRLNVPLENIEWKVVVPEEFQFVRHDGDLELVGESTSVGPRGITDYLQWANQQREERERLANNDLQRVNELLSAGEQTKARSLLNSVANNYALDAASNEDARVQLNKLQTQQAIVGLNTRRQRLYLDNKADDPGFQQNAQLELAATRNGILARGDVRYRPQDYVQFLEGNSEEENDVMRKIAMQLVAHQRSSEPAPQAINVTMPDAGRVISFKRTVQVEKDAPLALKLKFDAPKLRDTSKEAFVLVVIFGICVVLVLGLRWKTSS